MNLKIVLSIICIGLLDYTYSQVNNNNAQKDYIITTVDDTIHGLIYNTNILSLQKRVIFSNDSIAKRKYKRNELKGFKTGNANYKQMPLKKGFFFLKKEHEGEHITIYAYYKRVWIPLLIPVSSGSTIEKNKNTISISSHWMYLPVYVPTPFKKKKICIESSLSNQWVYLHRFRRDAMNYFKGYSDIIKKIGNKEITKKKNTKELVLLFDSLYTPINDSNAKQILTNQINDNSFLFEENNFEQYFEAAHARIVNDSTVRDVKISRKKYGNGNVKFQGIKVHILRPGFIPDFYYNIGQWHYYNKQGNLIKIKYFNMHGKLIKEKIIE